MLIATHDKTGILTLSSMGMFTSSATLAAMAPDKAIDGCKKNMPNKNVDAKHASVPSKLFFEFLNFLFPKFMPTKAAKVSPIDKNAIATKAMSGGKKAIHTIAETSRYDAPVKLCISCLRSITPNIK